MGGSGFASHVIAFNPRSFGGPVQIRNVEQGVPKVPGRLDAHDPAYLHGGGRLEVPVIHINAVNQPGAHAHAVIGYGGISHGDLQGGHHQGVAEADAGKVDKIAAVLALAVGFPRQVDTRFGGKSVQVKVFFIRGPARFQCNAEGARVAGFFQHARYGQAAIGTGGVRDGAGTGHRIGGAVDHGVERGLSAVHGGCDGNYFKGGTGFVQGLHGEMVGAFLKALARI